MNQLFDQTKFNVNHQNIVLFNQGHIKYEHLTSN